MFNRVGWSVGLLVLFCAACGPGAPGGACAPGATRACTCTDGASGAQTCNASGTGFGSCVCAGGDGGACVPRCDGRQCGPDGCGGTCGNCGGSDVCSADGRCMCTPDCAGRTCGSDGCGGSCGTCATGQACTAAGTCGTNPSSFWVVTVVRGTVRERGSDGAAWDGFGGLPDPFVCLTMNGQRSCTMAAADTLTPVWNTRFPAATTAALQSGVRYELSDEDVSDHDAICAGTFSVTDRGFAEGMGTLGCDYGSFTIAIRPQ